MNERPRLRKPLLLLLLLLLLLRSHRRTQRIGSIASL